MSMSMWWRGMGSCGEESGKMSVVYMSILPIYAIVIVIVIRTGCLFRCWSRVGREGVGEYFLLFAYSYSCLPPTRHTLRSVFLRIRYMVGAWWLVYHPPPAGYINSTSNETNRAEQTTSHPAAICIPVPLGKHHTTSPAKGKHVGGVGWVSRPVFQIPQPPKSTTWIPR